MYSWIAQNNIEYELTYPPTFNSVKIDNLQDHKIIWESSNKNGCIHCGNGEDIYEIGQLDNYYFCVNTWSGCLTYNAEGLEYNTILKIPISDSRDEFYKMCLTDKIRTLLKKEHIIFTSKQINNVIETILDTTVIPKCLANIIVSYMTL